MKQHFHLAAALVLSAAFAMPALAQGPGAAVYKAKCAMCHGADGTRRHARGQEHEDRILQEPCPEECP